MTVPCDEIDANGAFHAAFPTDAVVPYGDAYVQVDQQTIIDGEDATYTVGTAFSSSPPPPQACNSRQSQQPPACSPGEQLQVPFPTALINGAEARWWIR
jgi:hypothetical protein